MVDAPDLQADDVLRQPTRARLFEELSEAKRPMGSAELARRLGMHVNGLRRHLKRLAQAGLVEREPGRRRRGRPADQWSVAVNARPGRRAPQAYGDLARWLARTIPPKPGRLREAEQTGREIGRELAPRDRTRPTETLEEVFARLGFEPALEVRRDGELRCRLCNCPYRASVKENPEVVCGLHRGITVGLLEELLPEAEMTRFEPHDPDQAGCLVEVRGGSWRTTSGEGRGQAPSQG